MLVLTRRKGDRIVIDPGTPEEIVIEVVRIGREQIRIGIDAGGDHAIYREELLTETGDPPE